MPNDAITERLHLAIEEAARLNQQALAALESSLGLDQPARAALDPLQAAMDDVELAEDYRYKYAMQIWRVAIRQHNIADRYFLARVKKTKVRSAKAGQ